ncbi:MAG: SNF2-related protein [Bacteroidales bacterium]
MKTKQVTHTLIDHYIDVNTSHPVERRGLELWRGGHITGIWITLKNTLQVSVLSSGRDEEYLVEIEFRGKNNLETSCNCPYDHGGICKHTVAALTECKLENHLNSIYNRKRVDPKNVSLTAASIGEKRLERSIPADLENKVSQLTVPENIKIKKDKNGTFKANVQDGDTTYSVVLNKKQYETTIHTSCTCSDTGHILCAHKLGVLLFISRRYGEHAFESSHSWEKEKKALLDDYGYTPDNYPADKLRFYFYEGNLFLEVLDPSITKISELTKFKGFKNATPTEKDLHARYGNKNQGEDSSLGYVIEIWTTFSGLHLPRITPVHGKLRKDRTAHKQTVESLDQIFEIESVLKDITPEDHEIISLTNEHRDTETRLNKDLLAAIDHGKAHWYAISEEEARRVLPRLNDFARYYLNYLHQVLPRMKNKYVYFSEWIHNYGRFPAKNLEPVKINTEEFLESKLEVEKKKGHIELTFSITLNGKVPMRPINDMHYPVWINLEDNEIHTWKNHHHFLLAAHFNFWEKRVIEIPHEQWPKIFETFIQEIQNKIPVEMYKSMEPKEKKVQPKTRIKLTETGNFLLIYPIVVYGDKELLLNETGKNLYDSDKDGSLTVIPRDKEYEQNIRDFIVDLHPGFSPFTEQEYYFLHVDEVMKKMWFFDFFEKCKEKGIEVYGIKDLKKIRYNPNRPSTSFSVKSGIDWFDLDMQVNFGEQSVSLKEVRKAVMKEQHYVRLGEDNWGLLPGEWLEQWSKMLKFGKVQDGKLKLSKLHFQLIEQLYDRLDNDAVAREIEEKKQLLQSFDSIEEVSTPDGVQAELRNYQQAGLNWLVFLLRFKWGGILADDMGLGKTLQMLSLFRYLQSQNKSKRQQFLVVAPTTLLFNWENEILKFTPGMKYLVHWGQQRTKDRSTWKDYDIILTTYGTLTRDIEWMKDFEFTVAVLDESQAIKNPSSLRFKAVNLINATYRFTLTGTPIENNTMELYAQMQFVNPGLLGSQNFFKKEYAIPIDKNGNKEKTRELQQLIKPFLLRRTKEKVAKELPPKTEIPFFCEMEEEQRKVYEAFKNEYRSQVLSKIDEEGVDKAKFNVLDALTKLRQICDSPALMNTEEDYGNNSVKLQEILRHVREKTGKHKVIIFSQFVSMLKLITRELDKEGLVYSYLDGSTHDRKQAVETFQEDNQCRIMVISLKAGGLGLNLTKADYIYLIDPWWNPAVEQQAIDRTHRIGQDKHIFAYKMICKDTVEEKILNLQERKKSLAEDLITAEQSFVKKLSEEDIRAIFE